MADATRRAFVCGYPVAHSRSPLIHGHWLRRYGISGAYERVEIAPDEFPAFIEALPRAGWAGGNITIPHKEAACRLARRCEEAARAIGAANTLWLEDGEVVAGNTDWIGFAAGLDQAAPQWRRGRIAIVLGAGGAARGVVYALRRCGYGGIRIVNRTLARARELADRFAGESTAHGWDELPDLLADADLLVNTTSLGMEGSVGAAIDLAGLPDRAIVADIVYVPLVTPLLASASARGLATVDGLGMLLHQAAPGFEKWFGTAPEVTDELRRLVIADMEAHR